MDTIQYVEGEQDLHKILIKHLKKNIFCQNYYGYPFSCISRSTVKFLDLYKSSQNNKAVMPIAAKGK